MNAKYRLEEIMGGNWMAYIKRIIKKPIRNWLGFVKRYEDVEKWHPINKNGTPCTRDSRVGYYEDAGIFLTPEDAIKTIKEANRKKKVEEIEL